MNDERVYEVEVRYENRDCAEQGWTFIGNLAERDWSLGASFERAAQERGWPAGDYKLSHLDDSGVSGSFYLYTLTVRSDPVYEAAPTASEASVEAAA